MTPPSLFSALPRGRYMPEICVHPLNRTSGCACPSLISRVMFAALVVLARCPASLLAEAAAEPAARAISGNMSIGQMMAAVIARFGNEFFMVSGHNPTLRQIGNTLQHGQRGS